MEVSRSSICREEKQVLNSHFRDIIICVVMSLYFHTTYYSYELLMFPIVKTYLKYSLPPKEKQTAKQSIQQQDRAMKMYLYGVVRINRIDLITIWVLYEILGKVDIAR